MHLEDYIIHKSQSFEPYNQAFVHRLTKWNKVDIIIYLSLVYNVHT